MFARLTLLATVVAGVALLAEPVQEPRDMAAVPASIQARIARVESGLLPGILIKGRPVGPMRLAERMVFYRTPGVSICVINDGAIEWAKGYGVAEAGAPTPVTAHTRFQAASISKPVAAMAALRLVQQGKLALDEDLRAAPAVPPAGPREKAIAQVDPRVFGALEGRYEIGPGHVVTVSRIANRLFLLDRDQRVELFPESETRFFELVEENTVEFVKGPDGSVSHMLIDGDLKARRLPRS
jgi:hypothetical protein